MCRVGLEVQPPETTNPADVWGYWLTCRCGDRTGVCVTVALVEDNAMGWPPERFAFRRFVEDGWQIEPPRCPRCVSRGEG